MPGSKTNGLHPPTLLAKEPTAGHGYYQVASDFRLARPLHGYPKDVPAVTEQYSKIIQL